MSGFFAELKRRNVVKVGVAYVVVGWILIEASSVLMPAFGAPDWVFRIFALLIVLGFPLAVVFAWAFEMTPDGLRRTENVPVEQSITQKTGQKLNYTIIALLVVALGVSILLHIRVDGTGETPDITAESADRAKTIAVLPFVNMSADPENEYFSDGIAEELLNVLTKVQGLEVSSRTSSFAFKDKDVSIPEIADQLGVEHVLEGSVRKAGNTVRITAQLIDVDSDKHLWSDTYDRELADIFAIQEEIATSIVNALKVALGSTEQATVARAQNPTEDIEAYEYYLQGRYLWQQRGVENIRSSIRLFKKAIERDPGFAKAHSNLAAAYATSVSNDANELPPELVHELAEQAARQAIELDRTLSEAHATLGLVHDHRFEWLEAEARYRRAMELEPREAIPYFWLAILYTQVGRVSDAIPLFEKARRLEPTSALMTGWLSWVYLGGNDLETAYEYTTLTKQLSTRGPPWGNLAVYHQMRGEYELATEAWINYYKDDDKDPSHVRPVLAAIQNPVLKPQAMAALKTALAKNPDLEAFWHYRDLGELDLAYETFEHVVAVNPTWFSFLWFSGSEELRKHPRFREFVQEAGLVDYWRARAWSDWCRPVGDDDFECDWMSPEA